MDIASFSDEKGLVKRIETALFECGYDRHLLQKIAHLPVQRSHAVRRLGSYVARGGEPVAIRLQFAQEDALLVETFLHELAHCLDHQTNQSGKTYRRAHGAGWQRWAAALQIAPERCGESEALKQLHASRLKVVAVCKRCGFELKRLRRLPRRRRYSHNGCGGMFKLC
jgi:hypothetical protein